MSENAAMLAGLYTYRAVLRRAVDGDTLDLAVDLGFDVKLDLRVRLLGLDAPETRTKDLAEKSAGMTAKAFVEQTLAGKDLLVRTVKDDQEKYGRFLATVLYAAAGAPGGWADLNAELLAAGLAKPYAGGKR
ncbi:MAG TPA: thermonuclease family protein [Vicinamibacteria bacterium]|nr:thermonuclease family protein [Vicinamibacteria bacterium]